MVRHVEAWEGAGGSEVRVHGEEGFAEVGRGFEVGEETREEGCWVFGWGFAGARLRGGGIVEDDYFVDTEDGEGAGERAG